MKSFQINITHNNQDLYVYAELEEHGTYLDHPVDQYGGCWSETTQDPTFTAYEAYDEDTGEPVNLTETLKDAVDEYLVNVYWDRIF